METFPASGKVTLPEYFFGNPEIYCSRASMERQEGRLFAVAFAQIFIGLTK